jgi:hypothetical protein
MWTRPWVGYFANYLEYEYFGPETGENNLFQFRIYRWNEQLWAVMSIPLDRKHLAYEAADHANLRLAYGVPICMSESPLKILATARESHIPDDLKEFVKFFPLYNDRVFTLEYRKGNVIYEPGGEQDCRVSENYEIRKLWEKHNLPLD